MAPKRAAGRKQGPPANSGNGRVARKPGALPVSRLPPRKPGEVRAWLAKTEPDVFSVDDFEKQPHRTTSWNGVRSFAARNHLKDMQIGDPVLIYHSNADPSAIVGVAEVVREAYPDPTQFDAKLVDMGFDPKSKPSDPTWFMVDLRLVEKLPRPIPLAEVKTTKELAGMALVRISQLSVQPVTASELETVRALARR